jgi:hypothetical protein
MNKRALAGLLAGSVAAGMLGVGLLTGPAVDAVLGRFPGSAAVAQERLELPSRDHDWVSRYGTYQTTTDLATVRRWYAVQFHISPASDQYPSGDCAWVNLSKAAFGLKYDKSVVLCSMAPGTRIHVSETLSVWP